MLDRFVSLVGGVSLRKAATGDTWSYPNIHGDVVATANAAGVKQGLTLSYDPFGTALTTPPDNATANFDYGWLGQYQRGTEHATGVTPTIEMGARPYVPSVGRFLETDPVVGGSANDYDYAGADPINGSDLTGTTGHRRLPDLDSICLAGNENDLTSMRCVRYRTALVTGDSDYFYKNKNLKPKPGRPNKFLASAGAAIKATANFTNDVVSPVASRVADFANNYGASCIEGASAAAPVAVVVAAPTGIGEVPAGAAGPVTGCAGGAGLQFTFTINE